MKIKFITLALITATVNLFGDPSSPYRCKMSGNKLEADIIVVGGGAAGCILMSKLSEKGQFSVLGIEGGPNLTDDPAIEAVGLPAFLLAGTGKSKYFWPGWNQTLPMPGLNGRTSDWTTGMLLGGAHRLMDYTMAVAQTHVLPLGRNFWQQKLELGQYSGNIQGA